MGAASYSLRVIVPLLHHAGPLSLHHSRRIQLILQHNAPHLHALTVECEILSSVKSQITANVTTAKAMQDKTTYCRMCVFICSWAFCVA